MAQNPRSVADAGVAIGQVLLGKYRVESILGHGGMGVVAKAIHLGLDKFVAIKMLRQDVLLDHDAKERFLREAQAASRLRSEHVAEVVDVGHFTDTGVPYMVMEFLDGHDLGDLVDDGALPAPFATMLMLQAAEALAEAHSKGIVHRDVKPSNLFVTRRPDGTPIVKVLDFGISKAPSGTDMKLTQTQSLLGTPAYMSPEQMRSARLVDARTDIWSFGTVFYELLEGRRPFEAESFSEMCVKVAVDPPSPMVNTPPALQPIILRCLAKSPDQRYPSMAELGRDLLPHVEDVHQASLLVERMQRVLGRASAGSGDGWESPSTGVGRTPMSITDVGSAPIATPWHGGSDPLAAAIPTPPPFGRERTPDPRTPVATLRDAVPPRVQTAEVVAPRSKKPVVFAAGLLVTIGIAFGAAFGLRGGEEEQPKPVDQIEADTKPDTKPDVELTAKPDTTKDQETPKNEPSTKEPPADEPSDAKTAGKPEGSAQDPDVTEMPPDNMNVGGKPKPSVRQPNPSVVRQPNPGTKRPVVRQPVKRPPPDKKRDALMQPGSGGVEVKKPKCAPHERLPSTMKCPGE